MIKIKSQDATSQYDEFGNVITRWDGYRCCWIVNEQYENDKIDWYGNDNDFPTGCTLEEFNKMNPNYESNPSIWLTVYFDEESYKRAFGTLRGYFDRFSYHRSWNNLDYDFEYTMKRIPQYLKSNCFATHIGVGWNREQRLYIRKEVGIFYNEIDETDILKFDGF